MKLLIIGAGNMGITYGEGFIQSHVIPPEDLFFLERDTGKSSLIQHISSHSLFETPGEFVRQMDLIILSVKPQDFISLAEGLAPYIHAEQLIISIMAGVKISSIHHYLKAEKIIRAMPNLPAQVGQGMTVFTTSQEVDKKDLFIAQNILNTTGKAIYTPEEALLDAATAISGSGPAYVFFFMQAMIDKGRQMGFSEYEAQLLVEQTFLGAINLLKKNSISCEAWIQRVSSKGGTTEAAMKIFSEIRLSEMIGKGLEAARKRSEELSQG